MKLRGNLIRYMINILQVLPRLETGGVERGTLEIASAIEQFGYGSFVASSGGQMVDLFSDAGSQHIELPLNTKNPITIIYNALRLVRIIKLYNIKILHARSRTSAWSGWLATKITRIKFVTTFHGRYGLQFSLKRYYNSVMVKGHKVIAVSHFIADHIMKNYSQYVKEEDIVTIPRGIYVNYFNEEHVSAERVKEALKYIEAEDDLGCKILLPGRISRGKGHLYLLNILHTMSDKEWTCYIVGHCTPDHIGYLNKLKDKASELGIYRKIHFVADWKDMPALYAACDVVMSTALIPEAFGRTMLEAQAMGKVVVATAHGGALEIITHGKDGFHIPIDNHKEAADILQRAIRLPPKAKKELTERAKQNASQYSLQSMCQKTIAVYQQLYGGLGI